MTQIRVTPEELETISSQISNNAQTVMDQITSATSAVQNLVSQGWAGAASSQFNTIWQEWNTGANQIQEAMVNMATYMSKAAQAYRDVDNQLAQGLG